MEKIVVANLKMNLLKDDALEYIEKINEKKYKNVDLYIAPSSIYLERFKSNNYHLTSQDVSSYEIGSYTGEISASQLKSIGVDTVIIGHSERRNIFNEDSKIINSKIKQCIENKLKVILCISDLNKLEQDLKDIPIDDIIIAYEKEEAIGSGNSAQISEINNIICKIKEKYDTKVIYGGSVTLNNIQDIVKICDGVIIGKLSLNVNNLKNLIELI